MSKSNDDLLADFERASKDLQKNATLASGAARIEKAYGTAYQALVAAGLKPQLRKKYRG